jgi:NTP pyrophosphatase (non-canonical NTP hydrolase)
MQIKDFKKFIKKEDKRLKKRFHIEDKEKRILARTVKLSEEIGELSDEVLGYSSMQRKEKLDKHKKEELFEEFADVVITTFLLAEAMNVNVEKAIKNKMKKISKRDKK